MKNGIKKLMDLKSIITLTLVITLEIMVIIFLVREHSLNEHLFLLFSNIISMVITYYFTRNGSDVKNNTLKEGGKEKDE